MKKLFKLFITFVPLIILILMSGYFTKKSWDEYRTKKHFSSALENIKILQAYEAAIVDESLCNLLPNKNNKTIADICKKRTQKSISLKKTLKIHNKDLNKWIHEIELFKANSLKYSVSDLQKLVGKESLISSATSYIQEIKYPTHALEVKNLLHTYGSLLNIQYATNLENFLLTYYLSDTIPISTSNIIFWDKIIENSYPIDFKHIKSISSVKNELIKTSQKPIVQKNLNKIDDMRIQILTNFKTRNNDKVNWIQLLAKKAKIVKQQSSIISQALQQKTDKDIYTSFLYLIFYISILFLSIIALLYAYKQYRKNSFQDKALNTFVHQLKSLDNQNSTEISSLENILNTANSKENIYPYIYEYFKHLNERCHSAEEEAKSKSNFLSTLSHEIRTPLNGIIGFSKLLKDIGVTQDQEEFLSLIEGSSQNLIAIVTDVLDLSKINADKMEIENVSFNIVETVESTVSAFTQQAVQKDIELGVFIDPFLSHYFLGDATKISQILTNLISNAVKFTNPYGKINIFVQSIRHNKDDAEIKFAVSDDGIGLSQEQIKNIFNPFTQATKSTSNTYGGTGLGLTISRKMVELMGGKLEVKSQVNKGSNFYFTLKLTKDQDKIFEAQPNYENISVGLALPVKSIKRQLDTNLKLYLEHLGAKFSIYYYEDLFADDVYVALPDIMIFDHHYAILAGELDQCASLDCKTVILTDGSLHSRINPNRHHFDDIIFTPISLHKCIRILEVTHRQDVETYSQPSKTLENVASFTGLHALVADDNLINRKLINIILEKIGLRVTLASDGLEALKKYQEDISYDIIFMDIQMPIMDGVDATRSILTYEKENDLPHVPIIALTANVATGDKEYYLSEGMDDYATKPLEIHIIKSLISKHCDVSLTSDSKEK